MIKLSIGIVVLLTSVAVNAAGLDPLPTSKADFQQKISTMIKIGSRLRSAVKLLKADSFHCSKVKNTPLTHCRRIIGQHKPDMMEYGVLLGHDKSRVTNVAIIMKKSE